MGLPTEDRTLDWGELLAPFPTKDIEWRVSRAGWKLGNPWAVVLAYVTARAAMDRLDAVFGPGNWKDEYTHLTGGVLCRLWLRLPNDREWIFKEDGAPETKVEAFKGGFSAALKRVVVKIGIGRYLYRLPETFARCTELKTNGWNYAKTNEKDSHNYAKTFYWETPNLMVLAPWAVPDEERQICDQYQDLASKLREATAKPHLDNIVNKYREAIAAMSLDYPELAQSLRDIYAERKERL